MEPSTKEAGKIIRCMERVVVDGKMAGNISANTTMTKNKDQVVLNCQMDAYMKAAGKTESKMGMENIVIKMESGRKEYGRTESI